MMVYNKTVNEYFFFPKHVGTLDSEKPRTVCVRTSSLNHGVVIDLYMRCDEDKQVVEMCFKTNGNPYLVASLEYLCREVVGAQVGAFFFKPEQWVRVLEIPAQHMPILFVVQKVYQQVLELITSR